MLSAILPATVLRCVERDSRFSRSGIGEKYFFAWDKTNYLQEPGLSLIVPKGMLYDNVPLQYQVKADSGAVAFTYQLNDKPVPLHASCELRIGLRRKPVADTTKYYVARVTPKGTKYSVGGKYEDGFMKASIRELAHIRLLWTLFLRKLYLLTRTCGDETERLSIG